MTRRIRTILYGDQQIEATELDLLHTPALQRLYELHQLGLTDRVFVDASHSRLQHVIGVLEQVDNIVDSIAANLDRRKHRKLDYRDSSGAIAKVQARQLAGYVRGRRRAARLMGLLHDLTHAPYGHTLEDEIGLQPQKHDDPNRQADAFYRLLCQYVGWLAIDSDSAGVFATTEAPSRAPFADTQHVSPQLRLAALLDTPTLMAAPDDDAFLEYVASLMAPLLDEHVKARTMSRAPSCEDLRQLLRDLRFAMRALLWLDALHKDKLDDLLPNVSDESRSILDDGKYAFERLIDRILARAGAPAVEGEERFLLQRDAFLLDVIGNTICADLLDYAKRDSHFAGLRLDYDVDRIVENFTVVSHRRNRNPDERKDEYGTLEPLLRTAISIFSHKLRIDVPGELMNLLQVRFYVYQRVLFHPTKCIAGAMLGSAVHLMGWKVLPVQYRFVGDAVFLHEIGEVARLVRDLLRRYPDLDVRVSERLSAVLGTIDALPATSVTAAGRELLTTRAGDPVSTVLEDLQASIRLLDRLKARRYHRPTFRLLPNVATPGLGLNATSVARFFLDAENRARAEREIEWRAGLPRGTVTIHCPSGDGPRKIAEILVLSERRNGERAEPLRMIASVDSQIFSKHEEAIKAVEEMYASMWRLVVSVAPPFHTQYAMLNHRISRVLFAALRRENYEGVYGERSDEELDRVANARSNEIPGIPNDDNMLRELEGANDRDGEDTELVRLIHADGRQETRSKAFLTVADQAVPLLGEANNAIRGFVESGRWAAESSQPPNLHEALDQVIRRPQTDPRRPGAALGEDISPRGRRKPMLDPGPDLLTGAADPSGVTDEATTRRSGGRTNKKASGPEGPGGSPSA